MGAKKEERHSLPFVLSIIGGIFTVLFEILAIFLIMREFDVWLFIFSLIGIITGAFVIHGSILLKLDGFRKGIDYIIIFSIIGLTTIRGFYGLGPLISLVGGILAKIKY